MDCALVTSLCPLSGAYLEDLTLRTEAEAATPSSRFCAIFPSDGELRRGATKGVGSGSGGADGSGARSSKSRR